MLTIRDATGSPKVKVRGEVEYIAAPAEDKTGLMVVGPTERGPAFIPKTLTSVNELEAMFGLGETYTTYTARKALEETDRVQVVRTLHEKGWKDENPIVLFAEFDENVSFPLVFSDTDIGFAGDNALLSMLVVSDDLKKEIDLTKTIVDEYETGAGETINEFVLKLRDVNNKVVKEYRLSFNPFSKRYIETVFENNEDIDLFLNFKETQEAIYGYDSDIEIGVDTQFSETPIDFENHSYQYATTPWILSQTMADGERYPLFRFRALGAGNSENQRFKIGIRDIGDTREDSDYDFFTIQIRDIDDTDFRPEILEEYEDVTLDPSHERYISRVIGDKYYEYRNDQLVVRGGYENSSQYVRVEMHPLAKRAGVKALPYGFERYFPTFTGDILNTNEISPDDSDEVFSQKPTYRLEQSIGNISDYIEVSRPEIGEPLSDQIHLGFDFSREENYVFLNAVPSPFSECLFIDPSVDRDSDEYTNTCKILDNDFAGEDFHLEDAELESPSLDISQISSRKFLVGMQGGFDGANPFRKKASEEEITADNFYGFDLSSTTNDDYRSYLKAIDLLRTTSGGFDFSLISTPGLDLEHHYQFIAELEQLVRDRGDAFYVFDVVGLNGNHTDAISQRSKIESNYTATYFGWGDVSDIDPYHDYVPAGALIPSVYIRNDNRANPWFAPAGYRRGVVEDVQDVKLRLTESQQDELYDEQINMIDFFAPDQIIVWGQKTMYDSESKLNRVNVRRLLVTIKSQLRELSESYLFEQNIESTIQEFQTDIQRYLAGIKSNQGLFNYDVTLNSAVEAEGQSTIEDEHTIEGQIDLLPVDVAEYLLINFTIQSEQITFNNTN